MATLTIREDVKPAGLDWISALRGPAVRSLVESGAVQLSLFDERRDLVEIRSDAYPGERLMVCRNPLLAKERARKRDELLQATEALLEPIVAATRREKWRLKGADKIGVRVGKVVGKYKMAKHFELDIEHDAFGYRRKPESIAAEAALDGLYVVRTSLAERQLDAEATVRAYKRLSAVERAFRSLKTVDLKVRPVFHRTAERVRAHVLLCMLAYYVEWHMRQRLRPLLFDDDDPAAAEAARISVVAPAKVSDAAREKARSKRTANGLPVHSFRTLLGDLATIAKNRVVPQVPAPSRSRSSPGPPRYSAKPSSSSACGSNVPSSDTPYLSICPENQRVRCGRLWNFRLEPGCPSRGFNEAPQKTGENRGGRSGHCGTAAEVASMRPPQKTGGKRRQAAVQPNGCGT